MYDITDQHNVDILAQMISAETSGLANAEPEEIDKELAIVVASFIKQLVTHAHVGCIVR